MILRCSMIITRCLPGFKPEFHLKPSKHSIFRPKMTNFWPILGNFWPFERPKSQILGHFWPKISEKSKILKGFQFCGPDIENSNHLPYFNHTTISIHARTPDRPKFYVSKICSELVENWLFWPRNGQFWVIFDQIRAIF